MSKTITATFKTRLAAEDALRRLEARGFTEDQISIVVTDETRGKSFAIKEGTKAEEGLATGATVGGLAGAVLAGLTTAGTVVIPGLNLVVFGTLVGAAAGLGAGAATGGLLGALIGAGIPEHEVKRYEQELKDGSILLAVEAESSERAKVVKDILEHVDAYNIAA